jgi:hypothetical protein
MNVSGFTVELVSGFELKNLFRIMLNMQLIPLPDFQYFAKNHDPHFENHFSMVHKKVKLSLQQALKAHRGLRGRGSHIF